MSVVDKFKTDFYNAISMKKHDFIHYDFVKYCIHEYRSENMLNGKTVLQPINYIWQLTVLYHLN